MVLSCGRADPSIDDSGRRQLDTGHPQETDGKWSKATSLPCHPRVQAASSQSAPSTGNPSITSKLRPSPLASPSDSQLSHEFRAATAAGRVWCPSSGGESQFEGCCGVRAVKPEWMPYMQRRPRRRELCDAHRAVWGCRRCAELDSNRWVASRAPAAQGSELEPCNTCVVMPNDRA